MKPRRCEHSHNLDIIVELHQLVADGLLVVVGEGREARYAPTEAGQAVLASWPEGGGL